MWPRLLPCGLLQFWMLATSLAMLIPNRAFLCDGMQYQINHVFDVIDSNSDGTISTKVRAATIVIAYCLTLLEQDRISSPHDLS